jgi:hypothetical protein
MAYNKREHLRDNIEALRIALAARPEDIVFSQRQVLKRYSGFGWLKCVLNPVQSDGDIEK